MNGIPTTLFLEPSMDRTTRYIPGFTLRAVPTMRLGLGYCTPPISSMNNRFEEFDDDPLTPEEMTDLAISYRELAEGKGEILPKEMSDEDFLANL